MNKYFLSATLVVVMLVGFGIPSVSSAITISDYPVGVAANGIMNSRHNLGSTSSRLSRWTTDTSEVCVFCHTPHHGTASSGPLWNRSNNQPAPFNAYGTTLAGTVVGAPGGATLACLSCHDGATTFDTLINAPGKGNGGANNTTATDQNWSFFMVNGGGKIKAAQDQLNVVSAKIGMDLTNDHPVSVSYAERKASLRPLSTVISTIDLTAGMDAASTDPNLLQNLWAVDGAISDSVTIASLLKDGKVECSSCHDPHFSNKSWDEVESTWQGGESKSDGLFLRRIGGNSGSGVCRTCHSK